MVVRRLAVKGDGKLSGKSQAGCQSAGLSVRSSRTPSARPSPRSTSSREMVLRFSRTRFGTK